MNEYVSQRSEEPAGNSSNWSAMVDHTPLGWMKCREGARDFDIRGETTLSVRAGWRLASSGRGIAVGVVRPGKRELHATGKRVVVVAAESAMDSPEHTQRSAWSAQPTSKIFIDVTLLRRERSPERTVALGRFLDDGAIPIDNNLVERQHVPVALTRKNFLFVGSDAGGERAAVMYTLLGSCALNDVDPVVYLADVLPQLVRGVTPEQARELLPHRWKAARAPADIPPGPAAAEP